MIVSKRRPSAQNQFTFENKPLNTCKSYAYLGCIISNNGSFKLNIDELCKSASRAMYNLLGKVNKHLSGNVYILTELFDKIILPMCTYNCKVWGASFFPKNFSPADFQSEKLFNPYKNGKVLESCDRIFKSYNPGYLRTFKATTQRS